MINEHNDRIQFASELGFALVSLLFTHPSHVKVDHTARVFYFLSSVWLLKCYERGPCVYCKVSVKVSLISLNQRLNEVLP